jgi:hypothetical protein
MVADIGERVAIDAQQSARLPTPGFRSGGRCGTRRRISWWPRWPAWRHAADDHALEFSAFVPCGPTPVSVPMAIYPP